jgi:predicted nicotinamide N-methyase
MRASGLSQARRITCALRMSVFFWLRGQLVGVLVSNQQKTMSEGEWQEEEEEEDLSWQRAYLGYHERFVGDYFLPLYDGRRVRIAQAPAPESAHMERERDPGITGTTVWDAGIVLALYLTHPEIVARFNSAPVNHVLELGSGTGVVALAIAAAWRARHVTATDILGVLPLLRRNISLNKAITRPGTSVIARQLRWAEADDALQVPFIPCDVLVGSDLVYADSIDQIALLLSTLQRVCSPATHVFLAMHKLHHPERVGLAIQHLQSAFSSVDVIPTEAQPQLWRTRTVVVVHCTGLQASL